MIFSPLKEQDSVLSQNFDSYKVLAENHKKWNIKTPCVALGTYVLRRCRL